MYTINTKYTSRGMPQTRRAAIGTMNGLNVTCSVRGVIAIVLERALGETTKSLCADIYEVVCRAACCHVVAWEWGGAKPI